MSFSIFSCVSALFLLSAVGVAVTLGVNQQWQTTITDSNDYYFDFWWNKCLGSGHASLALRSDWQTQLKLVKDEIGVDYIRFHGILGDDVGMVNGVNDYSFVNNDKILDYMLSLGVRPYMEISFMPRDLASNQSCSLFHYNAIVSPPKSWTDWYQFIQAWIQHLVDRYGVAEVSQWYFEVWNEPNGKFYQNQLCGNAGFDDYMALYANTSRAIKSVSVQLRVGGPATNSLMTWITEFMQNTAANDLPLDFLASHSYPSVSTANYAQYGRHWYGHNLNTMNAAIASIPKYGSNPNFTFMLSEFNSGLNIWGSHYDNHDSEYAAAFMMYLMSDLQPIFKRVNASNYFQLMSYWTFSDIFEEDGFFSAPFWNSSSNQKNKYFGMISIQDFLLFKPVFRAMQVVKQYGSQTAYPTLNVNGNNAVNQTVSMFTTLRAGNDNDKDGNGDNNALVSIFMANWNFFGYPIANETVDIFVTNTKTMSVPIPIPIPIPMSTPKTTEPKSAVIYRIDKENANAYTKWVNMGRVVYPTAEQLSVLNDSSQVLARNVQWNVVNDTTIVFKNIVLPVYGSAVICLQY